MHSPVPGSFAEIERSQNAVTLVRVAAVFSLPDVYLISLLRLLYHIRRVFSSGPGEQLNHSYVPLARGRPPGDIPNVSSRQAHNIKKGECASAFSFFDIQQKHKIELDFRAVHNRILHTAALLLPGYIIGLRIPFVLLLSIW
jgi:hypothetical protein